MPVHFFFHFFELICAVLASVIIVSWLFDSFNNKSCTVFFKCELKNLNFSLFFFFFSFSFNSEIYHFHCNLYCTIAHDPDSPSVSELDCSRFITDKTIFLFPCPAGSTPVGIFAAGQHQSLATNMPTHPIFPYPYGKQATSWRGGPTPLPPFVALKCTVCGKIFDDMTKLTKHQRTHRVQPSNKLKCSYCSKEFPWRAYLLRHERTHTGEKPFACKICGKTFGLLSNCNQHERRHKKHML